VKRTIIFLVVALALFACQQKKAEPLATAVAPPMTASSAAPALPPGHPPIPAQVAAAPAVTNANALSGKVIETLDAGGYTYVHMQTASGEEWAAVPQSSIKKGATVNIAVQMAMDHFESKTLNRKFDRVLFGTIAGEAVAAAPVSKMPPHMMSSSADSGDINVARAEGGKSVAEVWAQKASLKDSQVVVRGKVVKFLPGIMGKNWLHLRDGSGSAKAGDNDLTVTTNEMAKTGDVITIKGPLHTDKDFGSGYSYVVIVEDASIVK